MPPPVTPPPRDGLLAMIEQVEPGARPVRVTRLTGGLGAATHAIDLRTRRGAVLKVVLKRFREGHSGADAEWAGLRFARRMDVDTPEPIARDRGAWFGAPALVMTRVQGRPDVTPRALGPWVEQLARAVLAIQAASTARLPAGLAMHDVSGWKPSPRLRRNALVDRALGFIADRLPGTDATKTCAHADFHPGNTLWTGARLVSVIDWADAGLMPVAWDVAYCRTDLTVLHGSAAADRFLRAYRAHGGRSLPDLALWDCVTALGALTWGRYWVGAYNEMGNTSLTRRHVAPRVRAHLRRILDEAGAP